jgi:hypothetical protein
MVKKKKPLVQCKQQIKIFQKCQEIKKYANAKVTNKFFRQYTKRQERILLILVECDILSKVALVYKPTGFSYSSIPIKA